MYDQSLNQYQQTAVMSASPEELMMMLFDGAIKNLNLAISAHDKGDSPTRRTMVSKTLKIVGELSETLDIENGGEIAEELDALYGYIMSDLPLVNLDNDPKHMQTAKKVIVDIREAFSGAIKQEQQAGE